MELLEVTLFGTITVLYKIMNARRKSFLELRIALICI